MSVMIEARTHAELLRDANTHVRTYLNRKLDADAVDIAKVYQGSRDRLLTNLRGIYDTYLAEDPTYVRARSTGAFRQMQARIDRELQMLTDEVGQRATAKMAELLNTQPDILERRLGKILNKSFFKLPVTAQNVLGELTTSVIGGATFEDRILSMSDDMKRVVTNDLRRGLINGDDFNTIRARISKTFGVDKLKKPAYSAYGSVKVYKNEARRQWNLLMKQQADRMESYMVWFAMIDDPDVTPGCVARHGLRIDEDLGGDAPPRHYNCRCTIAVIDDRDEITEMRLEGSAQLKVMGYSRAEARMEEANWDPAEHPRGHGGKFGSKGGDEKGGEKSGGARFETRMRDASGETFVGPDGKVYCDVADKDGMYADNSSFQSGHETLAKQIKDGSSAADLVKDGFVRARIDSGELGLELDLSNETAQNNAISVVTSHAKGGDVFVDFPTKQGGLSTSKIAAFTGRSAPGKAIRYIKSGGKDRSETTESWRPAREREAWDPSQHPRDSDGKFGGTGGSVSPEDVEQWADDAGAKFDGIQSFPSIKADPLVLITDKVSQSTGVIPLNKISKKAVQDKVDEIRAKFKTAGWGWGHETLQPVSTIHEVMHDERTQYKSVPWRSLPRETAGYERGTWTDLQVAVATDHPDSVLLRKREGEDVEVKGWSSWRPVKPSAYPIQTLQGLADDSATIQPPWDIRSERLPREIIARWSALRNITFPVVPVFAIALVDQQTAENLTTGAVPPSEVLWQSGLPALFPQALMQLFWRQGHPPNPHFVFGEVIEKEVRPRTIVNVTTGEVIYAADDFASEILSPYTRVAAAVHETDGRIWAIMPRGLARWVLPGGHIDAGESPRAAVVREMLEETGQHIRVQRLIGTLYRPWSRTMVFLCANITKHKNWSSSDETDAVLAIDFRDLATDERLFLQRHGISARWTEAS